MSHSEGIIGKFNSPSNLTKQRNRRAEPRSSPKSPKSAQSTRDRQISTRAAFFVTVPQFFFFQRTYHVENIHCLTAVAMAYCHFSLSPSMNVSNGNDRDYEGRDITPASLRVGGPQPFPLWPSVNVRALLPIGLCISNIRGMFSQYVCHSSKKEFRLCVYDVQIVLDIGIDLSVLNYF